MKIFLILLLGVQVYFSFESKNLSLRQLADRLLTLGRQLYYTLQAAEYGTGDKVLKELHEYNDVLKRFLDISKNDTAKARPDVEYFIEKCMPLAVETEWSEGNMRRNYSWTQRDIDHYYDVRRVSRDRLIDIEIIYYAYYQNASTAPKNITEYPAEYVEY
uniref:Prolyl 4-hydroxylase alpha-subunit N-terminal domain-containing protein n=1 Tax=Clastoptera arizonana TaxID=38151 RepID=A0A1B6CK87_9HEMI